jgi:hypothetical protein
VVLDAAAGGTVFSPIRSFPVVLKVTLMVREFGHESIVTGVTDSLREGSRSVGQDHTQMVQLVFLFLGEYQKLESTAQAVAVAHYGSELQVMRFDRDGEFQGDNLVVLKTTAKGRS